MMDCEGIESAYAGMATKAKKSEFVKILFPFIWKFGIMSASIYTPRESNNAD